MVNVNRNQLSRQDLAHLLRQFDATLSRFEHSSVTLFLDELLGKEERLTIAKRLAAIVLIHEGFSEYRISQVLKLSPTTTGTIASKMRTGAYAGIIQLLKKKKMGYLDLLETLDSILHLGSILPHHIGSDRYRSISERVRSKPNSTFQH